MTAKPERKYCGNCNSHCIYHYPDKLFCMFRFFKKDNPIVATLSVCENWKQDYQKCFCVQEASKHAHAGKPEK